MWKCGNVRLRRCENVLICDSGEIRNRHQATGDRPQTTEVICNKMKYESAAADEIQDEKYEIQCANILM